MKTYIIVLDSECRVVEQHTGEVGSTPPPPPGCGFSIFKGTISEIERDADSMEHFGGLRPRSDIFQQQARTLLTWLGSN